MTNVARIESALCTVNEFEQTLAASGIAARNSLGLFVGAKMLLLF